MPQSYDKPLSIKLLEGKKIPFEVFAYSPAQKDAVQVAEAIGHAPRQVFKTLVVQPPDAHPKSKWHLAVLPADQQLDVKKMARLLGVKKVKMATHVQAERETGLQVGGISALALLNQGFQVYLDESARHFEQIVVSAGQRGLQVKLDVDDFIRLVRARLGDISS